MDVDWLRRDLAVIGDMWDWQIHGEVACGRKREGKVIRDIFWPDVSTAGQPGIQRHFWGE